jgi:hypothetical protein
MNIGSGKGYPSSALSNFAPHPFVIDDIPCNSMEGFLQSLKFSNPEMQKAVCLLVGKQAKFKGKEKKWWKTQTLYWKGVAFDRDSFFYQELLDKAYFALSNNEGFRRALMATGTSSLTHSLGKSDPKRTVLTAREFCGRLEILREHYRTK